LFRFFDVAGANDRAMLFEGVVSDFKGSLWKKVVGIGKTEGFAGRGTDAKIPGCSGTKIRGVPEQFEAAVRRGQGLYNRGAVISGRIVNEKCFKIMQGLSLQGEDKARDISMRVVERDDDGYRWHIVHVCNLWQFAVPFSCV
jgi:hypothetical protein